jgi:hypothetical protein
MDKPILNWSFPGMGNEDDLTGSEPPERLYRVQYDGSMTIY